MYPMTRLARIPLLISPPKNRALATIVSYASVLIRVRLCKEEPGSLKAMWPSGPIPPKNKSIPPTLEISCSYLKGIVN